MSYESWISFRYLTAKKGRFLSFLNIISIAGVAIGVMSLIVVISVMTGFGNNLREKIIGTTPHVMVEKEAGLKDYKQVMQEIEKVQGVKGAAAYIQGNIFLEESGRALGLALRGIEPVAEPKVTRVNEYLKKGTLTDLTEDSVFIGTELARYFGFKLGDTITLISPGSGLAGEGWRYKLKIAGLFQTGMADYDMHLVIVNLKKAQAIFNFDSSAVSGIGVKLDDPYDAKGIQSSLYETLGYSYLIKTWIDINRNLFEALFLEKWGLFIILSLMILVASFNIISTLIVTVSSKVHDIGIMKSIGIPKKSIRKIFTKQGLFVGFSGILWGLAGGFGICFILKTYVKVPKEIYSIDHVPVDIQLFDVMAIVIAAVIISFLATIYPAAKAADLQPVDALRYE